MPTVIAVVQQKGGCAKTTTAANLAAGLAARGFRVLAIDTDPQNALAYSFGASPDPYISLKQAILDRRLKGAVSATQVKNLVVVPADESFDAVEIVLFHSKNPMRNPLSLLREALEDVKSEYDYVIIDTPTGINHVPLNAICAADLCLVPSDSGHNSYRMLETTVQAIESIRSAHRPHCKPEDFFKIVFTIVTHQDSTENELFQAKVRQHYPLNTLRTQVRRRVAHKLAGEGNMTIYDFCAATAGKDRGAAEAVEDIENLINEVLNHGQSTTDARAAQAAQLQR